MSELLHERRGIGKAVFAEFAPMKDAFKNFGTILKGELKRTIVNMNLYLQILVGTTLTASDYAKVFKKNREKVEKIDGEVQAALDKMPKGDITRAASALLWTVAPGAMIAKGVRDTAGKVTPDTVDSFMSEYGFKDLSIGIIPVGRFVTGVAKRSAAAGNILTLNRTTAGEALRDLEDKAADKWYTPIERLLLLQPPGGLAAVKSEARWHSGQLLTEEEGDEQPEEKQEDETEALIDYFKMSGFDNKYNKDVGEPYVSARVEMISNLMDTFEEDIKQTSAIAGAPTFEKFIEAVNSADLDKFKKLDGNKLKSEMTAEVEALVEEKPKLEKFLKVMKKTVEDFKSEEELKEYVLKIIYDKEFGAVRVKSIESIQDAIEEIEDVILAGIERKEIDELRINPLGEALADAMTDGMSRLDTAIAALTKSVGQAQKVGN